ncbi:MAG: hypothetical protein V4599_00285 [Verrucomicrobiota bacterium]
MRFPALLLLLVTHLSLAADPVALGSRRELFVDKLLIQEMKGSTLKMHAPVPAGVAVKFDQPWEGRFSAYITVLHDEEMKKYRMYYRGNAGFRDGTDGEVTCYVESDDGIRWVKPKLGLHEANGNKENNIILAHLPPYTHNFAPFLDKRPGVPADQRYKTLAGLAGKHGGLAAFASGDGIHWKKMREEAVITKGAFDSQNVSFWSETEQCYVAYFRVFVPGAEKNANGKATSVRWVSRATSQDFLTWTEAVQMTCDQPLMDQIYISQTNPYFNAPHLYVATAARFMPKKNDLDEQAKKYLAEDTKAYPALVQDTSEAVLMTSRAGSTEYNRSFMEGWVRPGLHFRNWTSRTNYPACGILRTGKSEISTFIERHYGQSTVLLQRYTMRLDGFGSLHADYEPGEMTTRPITFAGKHLHLNLSTGVAGHVAVEIQDAEGKPIPGFTLEDCQPTSYDDIDRVISWKDGSDVSSLAGKPVRLRWQLKDADVFSFWFN